MVAKKKLESNKNLKESTEKTVKELCGFSELNCRCCGKGNDEIGGFLLQCATCKKAHYCSKECFNNDLPKHMKFCQTNEPLHRAPKHRVDQPSHLSPTVLSQGQEMEFTDDAFSADTKTKSCPLSKSNRKKSKSVSLSESSILRSSEDEGDKPDSVTFLLGSCEAHVKQSVISKSYDCECKISDSMIDKAEFDLEGDAVFLDDKVKGKRRKPKGDRTAEISLKGPDKSKIHRKSQMMKVESTAGGCFTTLAKIDTTDSSPDSFGKVLCLDHDVCAGDRGFRKPRRSTSLSRNEGQNKLNIESTENFMSDMSDSDGSICRNISCSNIHMSDMTASECENDHACVLSREREPSCIDSAVVMPTRSNSSNTLERPVTFNQPFDETGKVLTASEIESEKFGIFRSAGEGSGNIGINTGNEIATSDSFSDSSINSGTNVPYNLQRKRGFIARRQKSNYALSDDHDCSQNGKETKSEFFREEVRMKKRLNNLWSLPEATIVEKITDKRVKLQLSRSMRREKGRMHRCLGNLWKLSAASRADKENYGVSFEDWSDFEGSDSEEIRKRRGGGALGLHGSFTESSPLLTTQTKTLKHLEASEPKYIGWERPEWTEYQLRSTAEGKLIKNDGNLATFKSRGSEKPEWARHSSLRKVSTGSNLRNQMNFYVGSNQCLSLASTNQSIKAPNIESFESFGKLKATERGTLLKRAGSIRLSNRKNASCKFSIKRSTSTLSRSSSGSISLAATTRAKTTKAVIELEEKQKIATEQSEGLSITDDNISQRVFDRARILRTTSRGAKLLRGESLRRNHDMHVYCLP